MLVWFQFSEAEWFLFKNHIFWPFDILLWPWPSMEVTQYGTSGKVMSHTCLMLSYKFLVFIVSEKRPMLKFSTKKSHFLTFWPAPVTLTFNEGQSIWYLWKGLVTYFPHARLQVSGIHTLRERANVKVCLRTDGQTDGQTDRRWTGQIIDSLLLRTFVKNKNNNNYKSFP